MLPLGGLGGGNALPLGGWVGVLRGEGGVMLLFGGIGRGIAPPILVSCCRLEVIWEGLALGFGSSSILGVLCWGAFPRHPPHAYGYSEGT